MAEITSQMVKELREKTGAGIMDCKKALQECQGDLEKAVEALRKKGLATAAKKASRATNEGLIHSYIHMGGKIGVLIEVNCETDFVARTDEFKELVHNLAMQVAASSPLYVSKEDVPEDALEKERRLYREQALEQGKPEKVIDRIVEGKLNKFYQEVCLLEQPFIREPEKTVSQLITEHIAKLGENIRVKRFVRFQLGEE
ncbi:MAG: elongation factor Ts [Aquificota bacterium]|nr:MAG: elongation factor Ts [Aquificota bacterium]